LPGKVRLDRALGRCALRPPAPTGTPARVTATVLRSRHRRSRISIVLVGARPGLPVAIGLHGWGADARDFVTMGALDGYLGEAVARGVPPFAIAAVDGGPTYWHPRADGDDPIRMISDELLPLLADQGLAVDRIAVMGNSMGGYGALLTAEMLGRRRVAATAASYPAVFASYADARRVNRRAFDSPADFTRHDVLRRLGALDPRTTWVDCGNSDPFAATTARIRARLGNPPGGMFEGCHDAAFWRTRLPAQLAFIGHHLAALTR
jgi:dienelactone hydrolase